MTPAPQKAKAKGQAKKEKRRSVPPVYEWSPGVLEKPLRQFLAGMQQFEGSRDDLVEYIRSHPNIKNTKRAGQDIVRAKNVLVALHLFELFDKSTHTLTAKARAIIDAPSDLEGARIFASQVLQTDYGRTLVTAAASVKSRNPKQLTKENINAELTARGYYATTNDANPGRLRGWLETSGVVDDKWNFNETALHDLVGASSTELKELELLTQQQAEWLTRVLEQAQINPPDAWIDLTPIKAGIVRDRGPKFLSQSDLRKKDLDPLVKAQWIETKGVGRAKLGYAKPTPKLLALKINIPLPGIEAIPADLREKLDTPLATILVDLNAKETYEAGVALELLGLRILREIGLTPTGFRERATPTSPEADLNAYGIHLHYSRWVVQCKNTKAAIKQKHVTRELGVAVLLRAQVILIITTGPIAGIARSAAAEVAMETSIQVLFVGQEELENYKSKSVTAITDSLRAQAREVLRLKKPQEQVGTAALAPEGQQEAQEVANVGR